LSPSRLDSFGQVELRVVRIGAVKDYDVTNHLNGLGLQTTRELETNGVCANSTFTAELHLDEFMVGQRRVHLLYDSVRESSVADGDDGTEGVGVAAQIPTLLAAKAFDRTWRTDHLHVF
jgi:hypothetical protein